MRGKSYFLPAAAALGFSFLYVPMISLVVFSFNSSRLVTVWGGFSVKWYGELVHNPQILSAAWKSMQVAFASASLATVFGLMAALALGRFGAFRLRGMLTCMTLAPLVMPETITGLSLLLLFIGMESIFGWPAGRGLDTIIIAHTTFCMAFVAVIVQSRLGSLDRNLEEAALDLGARPARVFFDITLPTLAPALVAGWLLAFTLSLDDLVIASFVAGPGSSTLPMVVFSKVRLGITPEINALATLMIAVVAILMLFAMRPILRAQQNQG